MRGRRMLRTAIVCGTVLALVGCVVGGGHQARPSSPPARETHTATASPGPVATWPGYHVDQERTASVPGTTADPIREAWQTDLVGGALWATQYPGGGLSEFSTGSGARLQSVDTGRLLPFATPSFADGMLFLGTRSGVAAYGG